MSIHVSVCGFTVYGGSIIRMDEHVKERNTTCVRGMLDSILKVRSQGVDMLQEGFSMLPVTEMSKTVINEMVVMVGRIRAGVFYEGANFMINGLPEISISFFSKLGSIIYSLGFHNLFVNIISILETKLHPRPAAVMHWRVCYIMGAD